MKIKNPATCGVSSVVRFLNVKNIRLSKLHRQTDELYSEGAVSEGNVRKRCRL